MYVVPAAAADIALKTLLVGVLCHRVGWRSWETYVLIASLMAMSLRIIPRDCLELSKHFFFSQGRPDIYEMWESRTGSTLYLRGVCECVAIFAPYRRLSRLAASRRFRVARRRRTASRSQVGRPAVAGDQPS